MKTILLLITAFLLSASFIFSQTREIDDYIMSSANEYYTLNYLGGVNNGRGFAGIGSLQDINGVLMNPASLDIKLKHQLGFQYTFKSTQRWDANTFIGNYYYYTEHIIPTVYVAFGMRLNKQISAGFVYYNPSSAKYDFDNTPFAGTDNSFYYRYNVHSFNVPISYNFGKFRAGAIVSYSLYRTAVHGASTLEQPDGTGEDIVGSFWRLNGQFGLHYTASEMFSAGVTFTPGFKEYQSNGARSISPMIKTVSKYPMKIGAGIKVNPIKEKLSFFLDYNFSQTSQITGYKDKHNVNFGAEYNFKNNVILRTGFFTLLDNRNFNDSMVTFIDPEGKYSQIFVTLGGTLKIKNIEINTSVMDSHLSTGLIKNTYVNAGMRLDF